MFKTRFISMLVLLMTAVTGAWAQKELPYSYGFENQNLGAEGWTANIGEYSGIRNHVYADFDAHSGTYMFGFQLSEQNASLISPLLIGGQYGVVVSFWYRERNNPEKFKVGYTTDESVTDADAFTYGDEITASSGSWQQYQETFPAGTKRIAIKYIYTHALWLFLDDFTFSAVPPASSIGSTEYLTLGEAFAAAQDGETIKLLSDFSEAGVGIDGGKAVTLDLNGHIFTCTSSYPLSASGTGSQITIIDSSTGTPGGIKCSNSAVGTDGGKIIFQAGRYNMGGGGANAAEILSGLSSSGVEMAEGYTLEDITPSAPDAQGFYVRVAKIIISHTVDISTLTEDYVAQNADVLTGTLGANVKITIADGATVTLDNATINGENSDSYLWAGLTCLGDATIILEGTNTVKGFYQNYPGIYVPTNKTVTIQGDGSLNVSSNGTATAIGAGVDTSCGNIRIEGGTIVATGGFASAAIGGGFRYSNNAQCQNITITGGNITAFGGSAAAGIGGGWQSGCNNISISGGSIYAVGGNQVNGTDGGPGIGGGPDNSCDNITIGSAAIVTAIKGVAAPYSIGAGGTYIKGGKCGSVTIGGTTYWQNYAAVNGGDVYLAQDMIAYPEYLEGSGDLSALTHNYKAKDGDVLTGTLSANVKIAIADGATITLSDAVINGFNDSHFAWAGINCLGDATIILEGTNTVKGFYQNYPGIYVPVGKTVTIKGDGLLNASSNGGATAIGAGYNIACGNIRIEGGTIAAMGGYASAAIGGSLGWGVDASCGDITITGGNIAAVGGSAAAGIGGGWWMGGCGNITISGGNILAAGGNALNGTDGGAAIGGASAGSCGDITISDASIIVTKGDVAPYSIGASGPANGVPATCGTVTIDGTVYADGFADSPYRNLKLDEAADNSFALNACDGAVADVVTVKRTLKAGSWNTFALPFDVDATKLAALKMMKGVTVKELSSATLDASTLTLNFVDAMSIEAGKPYLVKVTSDFDLSSNAFPNAEVSKDAVPFTSTDVDFIPTLGATTIEGSDTKAVLFLAANNTLLNPSALPANIKGFRAYFQLKGEAASLARAFSIDFGDGETTGIKAIDNGQLTIDNDRYYDLQGRKVNAAQKGVYIQNGKKVIIK